MGSFRIDAVVKDELIEIQHGSLSAIRDKIGRLLKQHRVRVVKPIVARKQLVKLSGKGEQIVAKRMSPKRGSILDVFNDLVYFTQVFPHPKLSLEVPLVEIEEWRYPGHGKRRRWRKNDHQIQDQRLICVQKVHRFAKARDLARLLPRSLQSPFHTGQLAEALDIDRWYAQKMAYCMRKTGAVQQVGKQGNLLLYSRK